MNIKLTQKEFDDFIMLYLKNKVEEFKENDGSLFSEFTEELKKRSFWPLLNKVFLDVPMIQKIQTERIITTKEKRSDGDISILM